MILKLTDSAKFQIKTLCETNDKAAIKLAVKGGGCAGFSYDWSFVDSEENIDNSDEIIEVDNKKLVIDSMSLMFVIGTELDYKKEIFGSSFVFENPNAKSSCGCGTSFAF